MSNSKRLKRFTVRKSHYTLTTFALALLVGIAVMAPMIYLGRGLFLYYGDFSAQEVPFYQMLHACVRNGELGWSHLTDLGTDTLASYSFYNMGSPFFWLTIPFPNSFVPYLMGPLVILKLACAAAAAHIYLRRYVGRQIYAVLGGLLYAFSGFSIYNVFFFHFHEPMIVFPLLLAALDSFLFDKRRGVFAVMVCAAAVVNYYFFTGQVVFVFIYFLILSFTKTYKFKFKEFLLLAVEAVIGFCAAAFVLLPSIMGIMGNPRLSEIPNSWDMLVHRPAQRYGLIICAFLFPNDMPAWPTYTPDSTCKWASVAGWLPMLGMTGVIAYLQLKKRDWLKKLITLLILMAFVPILNSAFQMFNTGIYYTRWYYMLVLMMILATLRAIEDNETNWGRAIAWSAGLVGAAALFIGLMPVKIDKKGEAELSNLKIGVEGELELFWVVALISIIGIFGFALIYKKFGGRRWAFPIALISGVLVTSLVTSMIAIGTGVFNAASTKVIKADIINKRADITIDDLDEVRSDFYECIDNTGMYWKVQSMNCFQSSVSPSIMKFYNKLEIVRDVASRPDFSAFPLRAFLSCKYYFDHTGDNEGNENDDCCFIDKNGDTKMPYWKFVKNCNNFNIYENECYIPMGYAFDSYISQKEFGKLDKKYRCEALLKSLVLSREQMKKYSDITGYTDEDDKALYVDEDKTYKGISADYEYGWEEYKNDSEELAANSCSSFKYTKDGFEAEFTNKMDDTLLFFSVPYSEGFTATVNGEAVDIEKVDYGFMAVRVPGKTESKIVFKYETPGWNTGVKISLVCLGAFAVYMAIVIIYRRKKRSSAK